MDAPTAKTLPISGFSAAIEALTSTSTQASPKASATLMICAYVLVDAFDAYFDFTVPDNLFGAPFIAQAVFNDSPFREADLRDGTGLVASNDAEIVRLLGFIPIITAVAL